MDIGGSRRCGQVEEAYLGEFLLTTLGLVDNPGRFCTALSRLREIELRQTVNSTWLIMAAEIAMALNRVEKKFKDDMRSVARRAPGRSTHVEKSYGAALREYERMFPKLRPFVSRDRMDSSEGFFILTIEGIGAGMRFVEWHHAGFDRAFAEKQDAREVIAYSVDETRLIVEINFPRFVLSTCYSYELIVSSLSATDARREEKNGETGPKSNGKEKSKTKESYNRTRPHGSLSEFLESGVVPFHIRDMELSFSPLLKEEYQSRREGRMRNTLDAGVEGVKMASERWNLLSILKSKMVEKSVVLATMDAAVTAWEARYVDCVRALLEGDEPSKLRSDLEEASFEAIFRSKMERQSWISLYETATKPKEHLWPSCSEGEEPGRKKPDADSKGVFAMIRWRNWMAVNEFRNATYYPNCVTSIKNAFYARPFLDFGERLKPSKPDPSRDGRPHHWFVDYESFLDSTILPRGGISSFPAERTEEISRFLNAGDRFLGSNVFCTFLKSVMSKKIDFPEIFDSRRYRIFWTFLHMVTFLSVFTSLSRQKMGNKMRNLSDHIKRNRKIWYVAMEGDRYYGCPDIDGRDFDLFVREATGLSADADDQKMRTLTRSCHEYLTCFLPMAIYYSEAITDRRDFSDATLPLFTIYPWAEKSLSWLRSPDVSFCIQELNFNKGSSSIKESAVAAILEKSLPFRSIGRSISDKLAFCCSTSSAITGFMYHLARNTILGVYPDNLIGHEWVSESYKHPLFSRDAGLEGQEEGAERTEGMGAPFTYENIYPTYRPNFSTMMCHYIAFFDERQNSSFFFTARKDVGLSIPTPGAEGTTDDFQSGPVAKVIAWITTNSKLCSMVVREFLIALLCLVPQYLETQESLNWKYFWLKTSVTGNMTRWTSEESVMKALASMKKILPAHLLPPLQKKYATLHSNQGLIIRHFPKQDFIQRLNGHFKSYNEKIIICAISFRCKIESLKRTEDTKERRAKIDELERWYEMATFELSDTAKRGIWTALLRGEERTKGPSYRPRNIVGCSFPVITGEELRTYGVFNFITEPEGRILYLLLDKLNKNVSPKEVHSIFHGFTAVGYRTLAFVLEALSHIRSIELTRMESSMREKVNCAMKKKYNLIDGDELPMTATNVLYACCCKRVCSLNENTRNFGSERVVYDPYRKVYVCGKKKMNKPVNFKLSNLINQVNLEVAKERGKKSRLTSSSSSSPEGADKDDIVATRRFDKRTNDNSNSEDGEEEDGDSNDWMGYDSRNRHANTALISDTIKKALKNILEEEGGGELFRNLPMKAKKKIARTVARESRLSCIRKPPVITLDINGLLLIDAKKIDAKRKLQHCPQCGQLHRYRDDNWEGPNYYCSHCWSERYLAACRCSYCEETGTKRSDKISSIRNAVYQSKIVEPVPTKVPLALLAVPGHSRGEKIVANALQKTRKNGGSVGSSDFLLQIYQSEARMRNMAKFDRKFSRPFPSTEEGRGDTFDPEEEKKVFARREEREERIRTSREEEALPIALEKDIQKYGAAPSSFGHVQRLIERERRAQLRSISEHNDPMHDGKRISYPQEEEEEKKKKTECNGQDIRGSETKKRKRRKSGQGGGGKKKTKRRRIRIKQSMTSATGVTKHHSDQFSESLPNSIAREGLMINRTDRQRLEEKTQRAALLSGRRATYVSQISTYSSRFIPRNIARKTDASESEKWWEETFAFLTNDADGVGKVFPALYDTCHLGITVYCKIHAVYVANNERGSYRGYSTCGKWPKDKDKVVSRDDDRGKDKKKTYNDRDNGRREVVKSLIMSLEDHWVSMGKRQEYKRSANVVFKKKTSWT